MFLKHPDTLDILIRGDYTLNGEILAPTVNLIAESEHLNAIFRGIIKLPSGLYREPDKSICVGLVLLFSAYYEPITVYQYGALHLLESLIKDKFELTISIYSFMSGIMKVLTNLSIEDDKHLKNYYQGNAKWLKQWNKKQSTEELKQSEIARLEKFARVSEQRYEVIYELHNRSSLTKSLPGHNSTWLVSEFNLLNKALNSKCENINQAYLTRKEYLNTLIDINKIPLYDYVNLKELIHQLSAYVNTMAHNTARNVPDFDALFYTPYIKSEISANAYGKKENLRIIRLMHKNEKLSSKPGGKLGHTKIRKK